jgi:hypothetical protein
VSTVRTVVHPGWIAVSGPEVDAVVEAGDRHAEALTTAAQGGLLALLDALTAHGLSEVPDFVACTRSAGGLRVVLRGSAVAVLPNGSRVESGGRMPWADLDLDVATDEAVVLEAPEPAVPRGWRRPARLARTSQLPPEPPDEAAPEPEEAEEAVAAVPEGGTDAPEVRLEPHAVPDAEVEPEAAPEPEPEPAAEPKPVAPRVQVPQPDLTLPPPPDATGLPPVARVPATPAPRSGLIDAVPWRRPGGGTLELPAVEDTEPAEPTEASDPAEPTERTELLTATPPEVPDAEEAGPPPSERAAPDVTTDRGALPRTDDDLDRPVVLAVLCPAGHPSPPHAGTCRTCGREIPPQQPFPTPRPSLGVLRISTGGSVPLDRGVLLGRAPRVNEELPANQRPHLLRVGGPDRDISRNHAEVVLEGWHVLVRDLGSTNGTTVTLPGQDPVRLRPTEDQGIEPGTVVTLADEVVLTYEVEA